MQIDSFYNYLAICYTIVYFKEVLPMLGFDFQQLLHDMIYLIPAVAIALSCHEFAHAYVSYKLGDYTQKANGRLTLNPLKHLDPMGTLCLILFKFGWAKPVEVDPYNYKDKKEGMILVALAGPLMNLLLGFLFTLLYMFLIKGAFTNGSVSELRLYLITLASTTSVINIGLGVFNLIPLPPLDGSKVLLGILKEETYFKLMQYEQVLSFLLIGMLVFGILDGPLFYVRDAFINCFTTVSMHLLGL